MALTAIIGRFCRNSFRSLGQVAIPTNNRDYSSVWRTTVTSICDKKNGHNNFYISNKYRETNLTPLVVFVNKRQQSTDSNENVSKDHRKTLPQLMDFPETVWPSFLKTIKNWILINFIIRPYFDREFSLPDFVAGTKHALQVVSSKLAEGELSSLANLVASDTIKELRNAVSKMSMAQRNEIYVKKEDIYLTFPYQVGIMFDESDEKVQKRWVEITMVFHVMRGLKEMQDRGQTPPLNIGVVPEYRDKISICNYRFIKEFTQGHESDWTVNVVNHFKPSDYIDP